MTKQQIKEAKDHRDRLNAILKSGLVADTSARAALRMEANRLGRLVAEHEKTRFAERAGLRNRLKNLVVAILSQNGGTVKEAGRNVHPNDYAAERLLQGAGAARGKA